MNMDRQWFYHRLLVILVVCLVFFTSASGRCQEDYLLGPEDELEIRVWDHEDLTRKLRVGLDGRIAFPFVGEIAAAGKTVLQLQKELERRLGQGYVIDPHVSIAVTAFKSQRYFVVGNVSKPGTYPLTRPLNLVEALSQAGGLTTDVTGKTGSAALVYIVRPRPGEHVDKPRYPQGGPHGQTLTVSLPLALAGDLKHNIPILNGDTIYVPMLFFYVTGEVKTAGRYTYEKDMTVLQAVTTAGGFSDKAAPKRTYVIRPNPEGGRQQFKLRLDDPIQPGDTIVVPESWF